MKRPTVRKAKIIYNLIDRAEQFEKKALQSQLKNHSSTAKEDRLKAAMQDVKKEVTHSKAFKCLARANSLMGKCFEGLDHPEEYGHELTESYIESTKESHVEYSMEAICQQSVPRLVVMKILDVLGC